MPAPKVLLLLLFAIVKTSFATNNFECKEANKIVDLAQQCRFVEQNPRCSIPSGYINYVVTLYCTFQGPILRPVGYTIFAFLLIFLLLALAMTSDRILTPNLSVIAQTLHLSEHVAGETLLPFGNGAADIFTSIAAAMSLRDGDVGLLYGTLLGTGAFTTTIIVGTLILVKPFHTMQRPLLRVLIFYMLAVYCSFVVIWDGVIEIIEASAFFILYFVYLLTVLIGPRVNSLLIEWAKKRRLNNKNQHVEEIALKNAVQVEKMDNNIQIVIEETTLVMANGNDEAKIVNNNDVEKLTTGFLLELPAIRPKTISLNAAFSADVRSAAIKAASRVQRSSSARIASNTTTPISPQNFALNFHQNQQQGGSSSSTSSSNVRLSRVAKLLIRNGSRRRERHRRQRLSRTGTMLRRSRQEIVDNNNQHNSSSSSSGKNVNISKLEEFLIYDSSSSDDDDYVSVVTDIKKPAKSTTAINRMSSHLSTSSGGGGGAGVGEYSSASSGNNYYSVNSISEQQPPSSSGVSYQQSANIIPPVIITPAIDDDGQKIIIEDKPLWRWLFDGLNPIELDKWALQGWFWRTVQIIKVPIVFPILLTTSLVDEEKPMLNWNRPLNSLHCLTTPLFIMVALNQIDMSAREFFPLVILVGFLGFIAGLVVFFASKTNTERPTFHIIFAFMGFTATSMWIYVLANEVVNLIHCFGVAFNISQALLGLTCLAWGNSVGDFINVIAVAKQGYSKMAISACFSGALFSLGVPLMILSINNGGHVQVVLPRNLIVMFSFLGLSLVSSFVTIPLIQNFYVRRPFSAYLFVIYATCLTYVILLEFDT